jgi:hypothetical protein
MSESPREAYLRELRRLQNEASQLERAFAQQILAIDANAKDALALQQLVAKAGGSRAQRPATQTSPSPYVGKTRYEMAVIVLREHNEPMHIDAIALEVQSRAFHNDPPKRLRDTLMRALNKSGKSGTEIQAYGRGHFGAVSTGFQPRAGRTR